jgi:hypothetical protein
VDKDLEVALDALGLNALPDHPHDLRNHFIRQIQSQAGLNLDVQKAYGVVMTYLDREDLKSVRRPSQKRTPLSKQTNYPESQKIWQDALQKSDNLGGALKHLRQHYQIDLSELSKFTCLSIDVLGNLEQNQLSAFSAMIYYKGFVKVYLNFFGVEDFETLQRCEKDYESKRPPEAHS